MFLPAYCPFFNPIEVLFGLVKSKMERYYVENQTADNLEAFVSSVFMLYRQHNFKAIFNHCGYTSGGFNPAKAMSEEICKDIGFESFIPELD